jgi:glycosyltransferase involved in cell wall biosynthesis
VSINLPRLSVVIPSYNQGEFIERTIKSIVDQDYPNLDLILMDGGSADDTMTIVERYRDHFSHISSGPDGGQSAAIVKGFSLATGKYISWLNSDDTYASGALRAMGEMLAARPDVAFAYGHTDIIDANDKLIAHKKSISFSLGVMKYAFLTVPQMSAFWTKQLYDEVGGIDTSLRFCMDYDLFVRMASRYAPVLINKHIGNFRVHGLSKTSTLESVRQAEDALVHARYCAVKPSSTMTFNAVRTFYTGVLCILMIANGSFWARLAGRFRNNMQSECS